MKLASEQTADWREKFAYFPGQRAPRDAILSKTIVEPNISNVDTAPDDEGRHCADVAKPEEDFGAGVAYIEIGQHPQSCSEHNTRVRHAELLECEDLWSFTVES